MMAVIISACLLNDPAVCREFRLPFAEPMPSNLCAMYAPPYFADWQENHPGWQIKRWRCTAGNDSDT